MSSSIHSRISSRRGQTLVEALVALSILTVGFVGIVALLAKSFQLNRTTSNDTQATYLAAEGIEVAKNIIDYDVYIGLPGNNDWGCSFRLTPGTPVDYALAYDTVPPLNCPQGQTLPTLRTDQLYFSSSNGLYTYNSFESQSTDFTRDVYISVPVNSPDELDVQSTVRWTDGGQSNTITLEDHFYNWLQPSSPSS
jgi:type II secretory pathway pseudopilin PulG